MYTQLTREQRYQIKALLSMGHSQAAGRYHSTRQDGERGDSSGNLRGRYGGTDEGEAGDPTTV